MRQINLKARSSILLILFVSFCVLSALVLTGSIKGFENSSYAAVSIHMNATLTSIMIAISSVGDPPVILIIATTLFILPFTRKEFGIPVAVNTILAGGLNSILKLLFARPRPNILRLVTETGYAFPSGHAMNSTALFVIILLIVFRITKNNKIRIPALCIAIIFPFCIGISRLYLGVHYAGDIFAGWILGVAVSLLVDTVWQYIRIRRPKDNLGAIPNK